MRIRIIYHRFLNLEDVEIVLDKGMQEKAEEIKKGGAEIYSKA